jgi:hypothetical protein
MSRCRRSPSSATREVLAQLHDTGQRDAAGIGVPSSA